MLKNYYQRFLVYLATVAVCLIGAHAKAQGFPQYSFQRNYTFNNSPQQRIFITTSGLPTANVGIPYRATLSAIGGIGSYTWSADDLPPGLYLTSLFMSCYGCKTPALITGVPTEWGRYTFTVTVSARDQSVSREFFLFVAPRPWNRY